MRQKAKRTAPTRHQGLRTLRGAWQRLSMTLTLVVLTAMTAWAETVETYYVDADGTTHNVSATMLTGNEKPFNGRIELNAGWYVVTNDITYTTYRIVLKGAVTIILADGKTLTVGNSTTGLTTGDGISYSSSGSNHNLTIYGQSLDNATAGTLNVYANNYGSGIWVESYTQHSGNVYVSNIGAGFAIHAKNFTMNGGKLEAISSRDDAISSNNDVTINGGQLIATGGNDSDDYGIKANNGSGTITLRWTHATDFIKASSYYGTVNIVDSYFFLTDDDPAQQVSGTNIDVSLINGKKLTPDVSIPPSFTVSADGNTYTINTAAGWDYFCNQLANNDYGYFTGKTVKLGYDITVSRMAGDLDHPFTGTFDGNGKTLTFNYTATEPYTAPFRYMDGGRIENLHVDGTIHTAYMYAAGIVGSQQGAVTIRNCRSSITIDSTTDGNGTHGGLVANNSDTQGTDLTIEGCMFDGKLLTTNGTTHCAGIVGWRGGTVTITNSLYAPAALDAGETWAFENESATFCRNGATITNSYYTQAFGTAQGKAACGASAALVGNPTAETYTISGITPYANGFTRTIGNDVTLYYGGGDNVSVSYVNAYGNTDTHEAIALGGSESNIAGWYFVGSDIDYSQTVTLNGDANLILGDGYKMNFGSEYLESSDCIKGGYALTIYGQSGQTGTLNAYNAHPLNATIDVKHYFQHGGIVNLDASGNEAFCDHESIITGGTLNVVGNHDGELTVSGGTVSFTDCIISKLTVSGGNVTIDGKIWDNATLGWTSVTDRIKVTTYGSTVNIAEGDAFLTDDATPVQISGTNIDVSLINGKTLTPDVSFAFTVSDDGNTYTIKTAKGWDFFCDLLANNDKGYLTGKTVMLGNDITVSRMAGDLDHPFTGTFDGGGKTLTFNYTATEDYTAPFRNMDGGRIENLHVDGTIQTAYMYAAGIIASQQGAVTIRNCRSSVTIDSTTDGIGTHGGLVANNSDTQGADLTIDGCVFDGKLLTINSFFHGTTHCAGFVGWRGGTVTITNSLYAPAALDAGETWANATESATFCRNGATITNSYYTQAFGTAQGKAACTATAALVGNPTAETYTVSGITPYANGFTRTIGDDVTFYYGGGDNVSVSYVNADGISDTHTATALDGTMTTLAGGWYFVGSDIDYDQTVNLDGDATLILGDGYKMNIGSKFQGLRDCDCIKGNYTLTIYGQSGQTGTLNAYTYRNKKATIYVGTYVQHSGIVNIVTPSNSEIAFWDNNSIITGGTLNVVGNHNGELIVSGGTVIIDGEIWGSSSLGWTSVSDRIKITRYNSTVCLEKAFIDEDGKTYDRGYVDPSAIAGKMLRPYDPSAISGDVNSDGHVTLADVVAIVNYILGNIPAEFYDVAADVNGDGKITISDAVAVVSMLHQ